MKNEESLDNYLEGIFKTYDSLDLLTKFSALNLIFENQNKNIFTTYLTTHALFNLNKDKPIITNETFKCIIDRVQDNYGLSELVDPAESSFFEYVFLDKEYGVFNGINISSAYYVNLIIQTLLYKKNKLPELFKNKVLRFIKAGLILSDIVFRKLNLSFNQITEHNFVKKIIIPNNLDFLKTCLAIDKDKISNLITAEELSKYFLVNINDINLQKEKYTGVPFYYECPFLEKDDKIIILDPTSICYFLKNLCIKLANEFNCKNEFIEEYNDSVAAYSFDLSKTISGVSLVNEKEILMENDDIYKTQAYKVGTNKAVLLICLCDIDILKYESVSEENYQPLIDFDPLFDPLIESTLTKLNDLGYSKKNLYTIIITSSITGNFSFISNVRFINHPMIVAPYDLLCIQINESDNPFFLQSFTELLNFYFTDDSNSMSFNMINLISMISERNYDLYINDDIRVKDLIISIESDFVYPYCVKAYKQLKYSAAKFDGISTPLQLIKYEENIYFNNPITCSISNIRPMYLKLQNSGIWAFSNFNDENGILVTRTVLYWLGQIKETLSRFIRDDLYIQIVNDSEGTYANNISLNKCVLKYSNKNLSSCNNSDNFNEISMVICILKAFDLFNNEVAKELFKKSNVENKKIIYILDLNEDQTSKPLNISLLPVKSEKMIESIIDEKIGEFLVEDMHLSFGNIDKPESVLKRVVDFLFCEFEKYINKFDWLSALNLGYLYVENLIQKLSLFHDNMKHQVILYPELEDKISENYNQINTSSVSLRFVVEYLSTIRPNGKEIMNEFDLEYAISIVSSIIRWAKIDDAFKYGLLEKAVLLMSYRIGFDHTNLYKFNKIVSDVASFDTSHKLDFISDKKESWPFKKDLDLAYIYEHGFTTDDILHTITAFLIVGDKQNNEIKKATYKEIIDFIKSEPSICLSEEMFQKIADYISISRRDKFYDTSIKPRELHPWKYNRTHSLLRKPVIKCDGYYIWGNRLVEHLYYHLMETIFSGKEPSNLKGKNSINTLNGKILEFAGNEFNNICYEYLTKTIPDLFFDKCVKSLNNKKIESTKKEDLGDIDILGIDKSKKKIYLIETKKFFYSRDPSELDIEKKEMFVDTEKRKSFLTKEKNRLNWIKDHIDDVIKHYELEKGHWEARYTFLTDKPLISAEFSDKKINATSLKLIDLNFLRGLNDE